MSPESDEEFAAILVVAVESGLSSVEWARSVIDGEIVRRADPGAWLIDASLAKSSEDVLRHARAAAGGHPALVNLGLWLDAVDIGLRRGRAPEHLGARLLRVHSWASWPSELTDLMWDLDEEVGCAHAYGGVPQASAIESVLKELVASVPRSHWHATLENATI